MTLQAKINGKIKIPDLDFTRTLKEIGDKDVAGRLAKNIQQGIDLKEQAYPPLSPKTIKAKGHARPLIDTGKLHSSFRVLERGKNTVIVYINSARREIAKFLQIDGVRTKRGKRRFNFFGVSTHMERDGMRRMEKEIKKRINDARR